MGLFRRQMQSTGLCRLDNCNNSERSSRRIVQSNEGPPFQTFGSRTLTTTLGFKELASGYFWLSVLSESISSYIYVFIVCATRISWPGMVIGHEPNVLSMAIASGIAMMLLMFIFRTVHVNPALTIAFLLTGRIPFTRAAIYVLVHCISSVSIAGHAGALALDAPLPLLESWQILVIEFVISFMVTIVTFTTCSYSSDTDARQFILGQMAGHRAGLLAGERRNNVMHDVIAMVGLPARGKTFISKSIVKYLNKRGFECRIFNVGEYRRSSTDYTSHDFFSSDNDHALQMRNKFAVDALEDLCSWLAKGDNRVAIYDATNSTKDRREIINDTVVCKYKYNLLFIESICNKPTILETNIKHKTSSPDYSRFDRDHAIQDFKQRIAHYESRYKPLGVYAEEQKYSFIQIVNAGEDWHFHHCRSEVQLMLVHFLVDLYSASP